MSPLKFLPPNDLYFFEEGEHLRSLSMAAVEEGQLHKKSNKLIQFPSDPHMGNNSRERETPKKFFFPLESQSKMV